MLKYKKVKKILITSNTSWNIYNFRKNLIKELLLNGNEIIILSTRDKYTDKLIELGCKFYEIKINRSSIGIINNIILLFNFFSKIKNINPDLIISLGKQAYLKLLSYPIDNNNLISKYCSSDLILTLNPLELLKDNNLKKKAWSDFKLIRDKYINV